MDINDYLKLAYTITLRRDEDEDWVARVQELKGCTAHGSTQAEALDRLEDAKRAWIESALEHRIDVPMPTPEEPLPSGKWLQRTPRRLHKDLTALAEAEAVSLNHLVVMILSRYVGASRDHEDRQPEEVWGRVSQGQLATVWQGHLEMDSSHAYRVLRSLCRRLPERIRVDSRTMEEEAFDAHTGKR
jgi:antitoxin HicB